MTNQQLAEVFDRISNLMEIKGELIFKIRAYERAAETLRGLGEDASALAERGELTEVPGIGKAISEKIDELLATGKLEFLQRLEEEVPPSLLEMLRVPGVGPKKVALFWKEVNLLTLADLEKAAAKANCAACPAWAKNPKPASWPGSPPWPSAPTA